MLFFHRRIAFIFVAMVFGVVFAVGPLFAASPFTQTYSVIVARPMVSAGTTVLFSFRPAQDLAPSSTLVFTFDPAYTVPGAVTPSDGSLTVDGVEKTLGASAAAGVYGYDMNAGTVTLTTATNETVLTGSVVEFLVGMDGGFATPATTGTHLFVTSAYNPANVLVGTSKAKTVIANPIGISAESDPTNPQVQVAKIKPELRVGSVATNLDAEYFLKVFLDGDKLFSNAALSTIDTYGTSADIVTLTGLVDGNYDIGIKTRQHLTRILYAVPLVGGVVTQLNFTDPANGAAEGNQVLLAGDIDGAGTDPSTVGDDTINSVDLSILVPLVDADDPTGNAIRANLNQDIVVNSVDLSIMVKNLDLEGDR